MDGVEVHYNSQEPSRYDALAFTRGPQIHFAPGEERHLSHEAWPVVQQVRALLAGGGLKRTFSSEGKWIEGYVFSGFVLPLEEAIRKAERMPLPYRPGVNIHMAFSCCMLLDPGGPESCEGGGVYAVFEYGYAPTAKEWINLSELQEKLQRGEEDLKKFRPRGYSAACRKAASQEEAEE